MQTMHRILDMDLLVLEGCPKEFAHKAHSSFNNYSYVAYMFNNYTFQMMALLIIYLTTLSHNCHLLVCTTHVLTNDVSTLL